MSETCYQYTYVYTNVKVVLKMRIYLFSVIDGDGSLRDRVAALVLRDKRDSVRAAAVPGPGRHIHRCFFVRIVG